MWTTYKGQPLTSLITYSVIHRELTPCCNFSHTHLVYIYIKFSKTSHTLGLTTTNTVYTSRGKCQLVLITDTGGEQSHT